MIFDNNNCRRCLKEYAFALAAMAIIDKQQRHCEKEKEEQHDTFGQLVVQPVYVYAEI